MQPKDFSSQTGLPPEMFGGPEESEQSEQPEQLDETPEAFDQAVVLQGLMYVSSVALIMAKLVEFRSKAQFHEFFPQPMRMLMAAEIRKAMPCSPTWERLKPLLEFLDE